MKKCIFGCMSKDTRIMMADGNQKKIEEIRPGDIVLLSSGKTDMIVDVMMGQEFELHEIQTYNDRILLTNSHPILLDDGKWTRASDVTMDDTVCTQNGFDKVISVHIVPYEDLVYNVYLQGTDEGGILANGFVVGDYNRQGIIK